MADLADIITSAVSNVETSDTAAAADAVDTSTDESAVDAGTEDTAVVAEGAAAASPDAAVSPSSAVAKTPEEQAAADAAAGAKKEEPLTEHQKLLDELGLKKPKEGERENRLPYHRVVKISENAVKRATEKLNAQLAEVTTKSSTFEKKATQMDKVDRLIVTDPDRYIGILATMHPDKYGKYVKGGQAENPKVQPAQSVAAEPMPQPDVKFEDNSLGYSPEQMKKRDEWLIEEGARRAEGRLKADFDKRIKPIEDDRLAQAELAQRVPVIRGHIERASKTYGKLFDDDYKLANEGKSEILKVMQANDGEDGRPYLPFDACVAQVLIPKMAAERNKIREDVLKEINTRPAAAQRGPAASVKTASEASGPKTTEDIIRESIAAAGLK